MNGERIFQVRELAGYTQLELAMAAGVAQSAIAQIEAGQYQPSDRVLQAIAIQTGFDLAFLKQDRLPAEFPDGSILYRVQAKVKPKEKARAHRLAQFMFEMVAFMRPRLKNIPVKIPRTIESPEIAAQVLRGNLGLSPESPIPNLLNTLERAGVLVLDIPLVIPGLDGFACWAGANGETPVLCLLGARYGYRARFTVAEEVGHLIQHFPLRCGIKEADAEARRFAGELLLPAEVMRREILQPVTLSGLGQVRNKRMVSYAFLIKRIAYLDIITPNQYRYLMMQISSRGWKTTEPGDMSVQQEKPLMFSQMVEAIYGKPPNLVQLRRDIGAPLNLIRSLVETGAPGNEKPGRIISFPAPS